MPTTIAGLLIFTALVLPGFAFITTYTLGRPRRRLSTLEATAAIVMASLVAELAVAAVYIPARLPFRGAPTVDALVRQPGDYWPWVVGLLAVSSSLAAAAALLLRRRPLHPSVASSWWTLFDDWQKGRVVQIQCELDDGSGVTGYLGDWNTMEDELADRDLILTAPITHRPSGAQEHKPHRVGAVCVSARRIVTMFVAYCDAIPSAVPPGAEEARAVVPAAEEREAASLAPAPAAGTADAPDRPGRPSTAYARRG